MRVCLFEDSVESLEPLTLTRPVFDLWCGMSPLSLKQLRHFAPCTPGVLIRPALVDLHRLLHPEVPANDPAWLRAEPAILVNGRWLPPQKPTPNLAGPCLGLVEGEIAYAVLGREQLQFCSPNTLLDCLETWRRTLPCHETAGRIITYPWDLVQINAGQLCLDFSGNTGTADLSIQVVGPRDRLLVDPTAEIDPLVVADTRQGPVVIDARAMVTAFTRLEGPCYIGPGTHVLGAKIRAGTTLGPQCRVGGEVEASIVHGHSNKYHDGFLGHSYVGEWVNLGAGTHNSDLRNDYGPVTVTVAGRPISTGLSKVGCFLGDHTKTGLGTLLNTGTNVGIFCNLLPAGPLAPKTMPSFTTWWNGKLRENADLDQLLDTAREVMPRRGYALTPAHAALYRGLFEETAAQRLRLLRDFTQKQLRKSA